ncbi:hypothetical protein QBC46DRAFT_113302 [Diplogelasinospora grovesii]|uniref:Uncharacterized protein n=1 Tax=Diplogelasinospora grovesii TaxID=303347 RepID=A0AAN6S579_9PEZI|nr:hypothetical protein QBC46DRAFT_113302 [Diplogelasinospora grovesii]
MVLVSLQTVLVGAASWGACVLAQFALLSWLAITAVVQCRLCDKYGDGKSLWVSKPPPQPSSPSRRSHVTDRGSRWEMIACPGRNHN